ncbi:alpha-(1,6)-fucosyltransferase-like, partial [Penaeus japonicus]|uniref:alpha-(1,6)-fucosyltransferase-like n=1 Tax=Penaeus japonicus TaxID=27405 RepID=UPI001C70E4F3
IFDQAKHDDFWEAGNNSDTTSEKERDLPFSRTGPNPYKEAGKFYRQVENDVYNTRQYVLAQLRQILTQTLSKDSQEHLISVIEDVKHYFSVTEYDIWRFHKASGLHAWQENEMKKLSDLIEHRIHTLQNPPDCESAKKILCNFPVNLKARGIGSQLHHLSYCFLAAYGTQRMLIINRKSPNFNMDPYFLPFSETCINTSNKSDWPGTEDSPVVQFPDNDRPVPRQNYFPRSVPKDFAERLMNAHGDPFAWWMGQFFKYFMRMTGSFQAQVEKLKARIGYENPIVGVQVRRTDKLLHDSRLIELEEYMEAVDDFFDDLELRGTNVTTRRIYLATDDPKVIQEAKEKYPNYDIVCNEKSVATASLSLRRTEENVRNFMADIYFLSRSDFLVCGMSSNIFGNGCCMLYGETSKPVGVLNTKLKLKKVLWRCLHNKIKQDILALPFDSIVTDVVARLSQTLFISRYITIIPRRGSISQ